MEPQSDPGQELVDLLDSDGRVVGVATRREIRSRRLPHRCTYLLVFGPNGDLLIHRRTTTKDVFPGFWDVAVGGVVASGEDWDAGVRREAEEELGVEVEPTFLFEFRFQDDRTIAFGRVFRAIHPGPFQLQASEVAEAVFVPVQHLPDLFAERQFCPDGLAVWRRYAAGLNA